MTTTQVQPRPIYVRLGTFDFRVRPPVFRYAPPYGEGPDFVMVNQTEFDADVDFLSAALVLDDHDKSVRQFVLEAGTTSETLHINPALANGTYPYKVSLALARGLQLEATGGSRPDIDVQK